MQPIDNMKVSTFVSSKLTNEKHAKSLANHFFQYYNKQNKQYIDNFDLSIILIDIYKSIGIDYEPKEQDLEEYKKILDIDRDGKITKEDVEKLMIRFLAT